MILRAYIKKNPRVSRSPWGGGANVRRLLRAKLVYLSVLFSTFSMSAAIEMFGHKT